MENKMKNFITLLLIAVTFLSFSSCDKKNKSNPVSRTPSTSIKLWESSALARSLKNDGKNRPDEELNGIAQIESENYAGLPLGEVERIRDHYVHSVRGERRDSRYQTPNSCLIWAIRRKLRHMHVLGTHGIPENAWYKDSYRDIRNIIATHILKGHRMCADGDIADALSGVGTLAPEAGVNLQLFFGIDQALCKSLALIYLLTLLEVVSI
jgi:hypothetical protein